MQNFKLAIDGPAGSGKSTISKKIAKKLNMIHIDTGAMYRAVTFLAMKLNLDLEDEKSYQFLEYTSLKYENDHIYINGIECSKDIRSKEVNANVSLVSSFPYVRKKLVELQKQCAITGNIIMDGRDIGTTVLPNANLKIFLTADLSERAKRRHDEEIIKGKDASIEALKTMLEKRDNLDSTRKESPLRKAKDAILLDTTNLTINQVVQEIIDKINETLNKNKDI